MEIFHTNICTNDSDEFGVWESAIGMDAERLQLTHGRGVYQADLAVLGELCVWRYIESQRILTDFALPADTVELSIALCPDTPVWCGIELPKSTVAIHLGGQAYRAVLPPGAKLYGVAFPESSMLLGEVAPEDLLARVRSSGQATAFVSECLLDRLLPLFDAFLENKLDSRPEFARDFVLACCQEVIDECFSGRAAGSPLPKRKLVDDATDLMRRRLHDELIVQDLLSDLGVSRRVLERAFRQHLGVTPLQYLLAERLHSARRMLNGKELSVLDACLRSGFSHPSRFSEMYARHFGELPSQTKKRKR